MMFLERSAGGRPILGSDAQWQTPQTMASIRPWTGLVRDVLRSSSEPHSGHRSGSVTIQVFGSWNRTLSAEGGWLQGGNRESRPEVRLTSARVHPG